MFGFVDGGRFKKLFLFSTYKYWKKKDWRGRRKMTQKHIFSKFEEDLIFFPHRWRGGGGGTLF